MSDEENEEGGETLRPIQVKDEGQFASLVQDIERLVVVAYVAPWCEISKALAPFLEETAQQPEFERVQFLSVDVEQCPNVAAARQLKSLPTFQFLLKDSPIMPTFSGNNQEKFKGLLEKALSKRNEQMAEYDAMKAQQEEEAERDDD
eukprot:TRINITY_DN19537_c0_g1_i1.p1 TRINITY_DN19537_c0_g1~~TRINITY_DN19537_c0_g1_i1.p1  ORF type:complete len:147 (+),score=38.71 TRINITY_DN19537_c0_g1_i1:45-485(+)